MGKSCWTKGAQSFILYILYADRNENQQRPNQLSFESNNNNDVTVPAKTSKFKK